MGFIQQTTPYVNYAMSVGFAFFLFTASICLIILTCSAAPDESE